MSPFLQPLPSSPSGSSLIWRIRCSPSPGKGAGAGSLFFSSFDFFFSSTRRPESSFFLPPLRSWCGGPSRVFFPCQARRSEPGRPCLPPFFERFQPSKSSASLPFLRRGTCAWGCLRFFLESFPLFPPSLAARGESAALLFPLHALLFSFSPRRSCDEL